MINFRSVGCKSETRDHDENPEQEGCSTGRRVCIFILAEIRHDFRIFVENMIKKQVLGHIHYFAVTQ
jgi:hypothetical protein